MPRQPAFSYIFSNSENYLHYPAFIGHFPEQKGIILTLQGLLGGVGKSAAISCGHSYLRKDAMHNARSYWAVNQDVTTYDLLANPEC